MKPVMQTRLGGNDGNCWPACLASIFECSIEETDHLSNHHPDWFDRSQAWLMDRGFCFVEISRREDGSWPVTEISPKSNVILSGESKRGVRHVCIAQPFLEVEDGRTMMGFRLIHDPAGGRELVDKIDRMILIVKA